MAATYRKKKAPGERPTRDPNRALKAEMALELAMQGLTYRQIAEAVGVKNPGTAHHLVQDELERHLAPKVEAFRELQLRRLNKLLAAVYRDAANEEAKGRNFASDRALAIIAEMSKLMGAYVQPKEAAVTATVIVREYPAGVAEAV